MCLNVWAKFQDSHFSKAGTLSSGPDPNGVVSTLLWCFFLGRKNLESKNLTLDSGVGRKDQQISKSFNIRANNNYPAPKQTKNPNKTQKIQNHRKLQSLWKLIRERGEGVNACFIAFHFWRAREIVKKVWEFLWLVWTAASGRGNAPWQDMSANGSWQF